MSTKAKFQAIRGTRDLLPPETALWNRVEQTAHEVFATFGFREIRSPIFEATEVFSRAVGGETDIVAKEMFTFENRPSRSARAVVTYADLEADAETLLRLLEEADLKQSEANEKTKNQAISSTREIIRRLSHLSRARRAEMPELELVDEMNDNYRLYGGLEFAASFSLRPEATASVCRAYIEHNMQQLPQPVKLYYMGPMFRRERPQKGRYRQFYQIGAEILGGPDAPAIDA